MQHRNIRCPDADARSSCSTVDLSHPLEHMDSLQAILKPAHLLIKVGPSCVFMELFLFPSRVSCLVVGKSFSNLQRITSEMGALCIHKPNTISVQRRPAHADCECLQIETHIVCTVEASLHLLRHAPQPESSQGPLPPPPSSAGRRPARPHRDMSGAKSGSWWRAESRCLIGRVGTLAGRGGGG